MNQEDFELLERYLLDQLSEKEESDLENRLEKDADLKKAAVQYQSLIINLEREGRRKLFDHLQEADTKGFTLFTPTALRIAAIFLLLAVSYLVIRQFIDQGNYRKVALAYYEPMQDFQIQDPNMDYQEIKENSVELYNQANYAGVIEELSTIPQDSEDSDIAMLKGLSYMGLEKYELSESEFKKVVSYDSRHLTEGQWYLSLSLLQNKKNDEAVLILNQLREGENKEYYYKSVDLLGEIEDK